MLRVLYFLSHLLRPAFCLSFTIIAYFVQRQLGLTASIIEQIYLKAVADGPLLIACHYIDIACARFLGSVIAYSTKYSKKCALIR